MWKNVFPNRHREKENKNDAEKQKAFVFLGSDRASYITGAILSVDGAAMT